VSDGAGSWARMVWMAARGEPPMLEPLSGGSGPGGDGAVQFEDPPTPALTVAFAPTKGERPEWVVQKLTELGVDRIVPMISERSVVRWEGNEDRVPWIVCAGWPMRRRRNVGESGYPRSAK